MENPEARQTLIGNCFYGYDNCQLIYWWKRFLQLTNEPNFSPRALSSAPEMVELFVWNDAAFLHVTEESAIQRINHVGWSRNIAGALGNTSYQDKIVMALRRLLGALTLLYLHIHWLLKKIDGASKRPPP